jgi:hypothetical protein
MLLSIVRRSIPGLTPFPPPLRLLIGNKSLQGPKVEGSKSYSTILEPKSRYHYRPLVSSRREIRLFKFANSEVPASSSDLIITGTLDYVSLDNDPHYFALSYVWGDPQITKPIVIDGQIVDVTANLFAFLSRSAPDHETSSSFWIDAICINQLDIQEKSVQVQKMHEVYRQAGGVVSWIGPATDINDQCVKELIKLINLIN